ncbi:reverse transcriptase domain-containing protein [Tanacetum coccineum]|uniref:Reverse transcriptase domain-containing protein n=1 Tax=Tanacetum coccineum TaxID=301880 RepID=A0ABQ4Y797_9ASTR
MPFGLCNAPATFQRCMTAIFHDMVEDFMEVFMDDFSVFGNSFNHCLGNLDKMLARCEETNLVLNWEKCHFMVNEGIVLGHKISGKGLENPNMGILTEIDIADEFLDEHLMVLKTTPDNDEPGFAGFTVYYIVRKVIPPKWTSEKRKRFFSQVKFYFWDEPYAFRLCLDNIIRRCVAGNEIPEILAHCILDQPDGHLRNIPYPPDTINAQQSYKVFVTYFTFGELTSWDTLPV